MILLQLFWSFFQIGLMSVGGGYAAMPLIEHQVVTLHNWLTLQQFADVVTIAEMTPGPIALNAATFVGVQTAGIAGAVVATLGCVLPSCVIVMLLAAIYQKYRGLSLVQGILSGLRPAVVGMIASAGLSLVLLALYGQNGWPANWGDIDFIAAGIFLCALAVLRIWKLNPIYVMLGAGAAGMALYSLF